MGLEKQMQTKVELQGRAAQVSWKGAVSLNRAERAVANWAMVDDHQAVLDANCERNHLLRHYLERYRLRACGLCLDTYQAQQMRHALSSAEIMYSTGNEIPWRDESFDRVLMAHALPNYVNMTTFLQEIRRVLKPGGCLVMALPALPWRRAVAAFFAGAQAGRTALQPLMSQLEEQGFSDVSCRRTRIDQLCVVARIGP